MGRVLTKFYELIWTNMYYESLWNHVGIQQGVFNRLKIIYYIATSMNNWKSMRYLILAIRNFLKKCKNPFANCKNASQIVNCERLIRTLVFLYPLKISRHLSFSDVFRRYKKKMVWNGLKDISFKICYVPKNILKTMEVSELLPSGVK